MAAHDPVPHYALYGEPSMADDTGTVHCETIAVRSSIYRWRIATHRHADLWQVLFLAHGTAEVMMGDAISTRQGPVIVIAPAGVAHGFCFSEEADGLVLTTTGNFMARFADGDPLPPRMAQAGIWPITRASAESLSTLGTQLLGAIVQTAGREGDLLQSALAEAWLRMALAPLSAPPSDDRDGRLQTFRALVEQHYRDHRPLAFYAARLNCTERTLSRLTRAAWGITPAEVVHRRIMLEARRLLRFTNASCAMVAEELGFIDPSYFSRFYHRMAGYRPSREKSG